MAEANNNELIKDKVVNRRIQAPRRSYGYPRHAMCTRKRMADLATVQHKKTPQYGTSVPGTGPAAEIPAVEQCSLCLCNVSQQNRVNHVFMHLGDYSFYRYRCRFEHCQYVTYRKKAINMHLTRAHKKRDSAMIDDRMEYALGDDFNSAAAQRGWSVHTNIVTGVIYASESDVVITCSRDKSILAHCSPILAKVHFLGPELLSNIEGNPSRINSVCLFTREDGVVTISEDRVLRVYLKRETGQYWPSIHQPLLLVPTVVHLDEQSLRVFVGFVNG
ncbi:hypothetical protein QR680_000546 [Steinernema hermaphroditum]|uniref:Uncharacterized protein n=1 Tax=Steinernema hermaphroditum TaxID=289476 RepID=A0AA39LE89_9BILA|nr:hypothetical protein QR680_000546 [Steinernema hermaphroditum]